MFLAAPGAPDTPRVGKVTKNSAELSWTRPLKDGGAPITGYIVEKKPIGAGDWEKVNEEPIKVLNAVDYLFIEEASPINYFTGDQTEYHTLT